MSAQAIIERLPAELKEKILKLVIDDNLKAGKNMGWDSVNRAILTRNALAKRFQGDGLGRGRGRG